jgi:E3 ubiquitin-protein ligase RFWD2
MELYRARDRYSMKLRMLGDDSSARKSWPSSMDKNTSDLISSSLNTRRGLATWNLQNKQVNEKYGVISTRQQRKDALRGSDSQCINQSGLSVARKKRVHAQVCYLKWFHL